MKSFWIIGFLLIINPLIAQKDYSPTLEEQYYYYFQKNENKNALKKAFEIKEWTYKQYGDTSLKYAISYKLLGNVYNAIRKLESAELFYKSSLFYLEKQKRDNHIDASHVYNNCNQRLKELFYFP